MDEVGDWEESGVGGGGWGVELGRVGLGRVELGVELGVQGKGKCVVSVEKLPSLSDPSGPVDLGSVVCVDAHMPPCR